MRDRTKTQTRRRGEPVTMENFEGVTEVSMQQAQ